MTDYAATDYPILLKKIWHIGALLWASCFKPRTTGATSAEDLK